MTLPAPQTDKKTGKSVTLRYSLLKSSIMNTGKLVDSGGEAVFLPGWHGARSDTSASDASAPGRLLLTMP